MDDILAALERWERDGETIAVATLVRACGSVPRLPGARLVMTRTGKMAGSVSGGCVEPDVFAHALEVLESGQPIVVGYGPADPDGIEVGLSCGGSIEVLIEPWSATDPWRVLRLALQHERSAVLALGVTPPALAGRKLVVFDDDRVVGGIDAPLDEQIVREARRLRASGGTRLLEVPWSGAMASVFLEAFVVPSRLLIIGATHTAMPLCRLAKILGFHVTVVDARDAYLNRERFPDADELIEAWPAPALAAACTASTSVVILTHDPKFDLPALTAALRLGVRYVGILGSRRTHERRRAALREEGFTEAELARIHAPIGLDIGARTPEEVALAILAEILAVRSGKSARSEES